MKITNSWLAPGIVVLLAAAASGCFEVSTKTQVNRDGTLRRTQVISGDSASVLAERFPSRVDSSWAFAVERPKPGDLRRVATRDFANADALTQSTRDSTGLSIGLRAEFSREFKWFFTEITYRETYRSYHPFRSIPLSDYVDPSAISQFFRHVNDKEPFSSKGDSLALIDAEKRFEEWESRSIFEACYHELLRGVTLLNDPRCTPAMAEGEKDRMYRDGKEFWGGFWKRKSPTPFDSIAYVFGATLGTARVRRAMELNAAGFASFREKLSYLTDMLGRPYSTSIVMPGMIINTNAPTVEGNEASWKDLTTYLYIADFEIWATSRVVNWWIVAIAGAIVVLAIGLVVVAVVRRERGRLVQ